MSTIGTESVATPFPGRNAGFPIFPVFIFVFLSACVIAMGWLFYVKRESSLKAEKQAELSEIANLKAEQITNWRNERLANANMVLRDPFISSLLEKHMRSSRDPKSLGELARWLSQLAITEHYRSVTIFDEKGNKILSFPKDIGIAIEPEIRTLFESALSRRSVALSELHKDGTGPNDIHFDLIVPVVGRCGKDSLCLGAVDFDIDPEQFLFPLIQSWPVPSRTSEVLLVRKAGDEVVYQNELRHRKNTALSLRFPLSDTALPASKAVRGFVGATEGLDYRGVAVLAVARPIPGTTWFMIAKIDKAEAYAATRRLFAWVVSLMLLLILLGATAIAVYQRHTASRAYRQLYLAEKERSALATELAKEKEQLLVTLRSIGDGVITTDVSGNVTLMNGVAEQLSGWTTCDAFGRPLSEVFHIINEQTGVRCENPAEKVLATGTIVGLANHTALIGKDGSVHVIADSGAPIRDTGGAIIGVVLVFRDITEKSLAEEALRLSEERFRWMFEQSYMGIAISDKQFYFAEANKAFCDTLGYSETELSRLTFKDVTHPEEVSRDAESISRLVGGQIPFYKTEKRYITKSGAVILGSVTVTALRDAAGNHEHSLIMLENITERKAAENALVAEKERLLVTLRSIGDAVIATDVSGRVVLMNKIAETLTGWTLSDAQGKPLGEVFVIINELTRKPCDNPVDKVLSTGSIVNLENHTVLVSKNGVEYIIADSGAPIKDRDGATIGVVLVFRDNTEKQKTQDALLKAQQLESIGVLAGGIAHDFNNLLSGLFGYLDLARESLKRGDEAGQYIEKAFSVFGRAKDLTGQLLTFSKGGAPARKIAPLGPLVRDAVHFALSGSTITCRFTIAPDLWLASFDENQISQVLDNIVINARDAMPMGGTISVTADNIPDGSPLPPGLVKGNYVRVCVLDQGTGISPEHLPRIFDPFFTTKQKGSGLGLATAYSIVKRHDGVISAESELGKGAAICVFLPASVTAADAAAPLPAVSAFKGRGKVLVMDDEDFIRDVAAAMLADMGFVVTTALHGAETISLFAAEQRKRVPFDLVILDLTVPGGMGGSQAKDELRKLAPNAKIIASSGYSDDPIMSKPQEYGFDAAVRKPYNKAELAQAVSRVMGEV